MPRRIGGMGVDGMNEFGFRVQGLRLKVKGLVFSVGPQL